MIKNEISTVELHRTVDQSAWRHFWLSNVMIERGKPLPAKNARSTMRATNKSLTWRLHQLRRLEFSRGADSRQHVRFTPKSEHSPGSVSRPLSANSCRQLGLLDQLVGARDELHKRLYFDLHQCRGSQT